MVYKNDAYSVVISHFTTFLHHDVVLYAITRTNLSLNGRLTLECVFAYNFIAQMDDDAFYHTFSYVKM